MMKIKCPNDNCRNIIDDSFKYCPECGYNIATLFNNSEKMLELYKRLDANGDYSDAAYYLVKCCKNGNADAMYFLGLYYEKGLGVEQSFRKTKYCMEESAKRKQVNAVCWIANAYEQGKETIERNLEEALNWYQIAFELGQKNVKFKIEELESKVKTVDSSSLIDEQYNEFEEGTTFNIDDISEKHEISIVSGAIVKKEFSKPYKKGDKYQIEEEEKKNLETTIYKINVAIMKLRNEITAPLFDYRNKDEFMQFRNESEQNRDIESEINKLTESKDSPYIARMILEKEDGRTADIYVGKNMIVADGEILVYSWDSPIGNKIYDNVNTYYKINIYDKYKCRIISKKNYRLLLRRKMDIKNRRLIKVIQDYPTDTQFGSMICDEFLMHILEKKKHDKRLTDIIPSIQSNQNEIITRPLSENLIVQGCAGSGKTMILLHRLAYLKTNTSIDYNNTLILTPSEIFNTHIDVLWKELKLVSVKKMTLEKYYSEKLMEYSPSWKNKEIIDDYDMPSEIIQYYYSERFVEDIDRQWITLSDKYKQECILCEKAYNEVKLPGWYEKKNKYDSMAPSQRPENPPAKPKLTYPIISILSGIFSALKPKYKTQSGKIHRCELYACLLLNYKMLGSRSKYGHIFIDEGQDISISEYLLINSINDNKAVLNIFGDIRQNIDKNRGIGSWNSLDRVGNFLQYELNENYRNTKEIIEYTNLLLDNKMNSLGVDGNKVLEIDESKFLQLIKYENGNDRVAVICKSSNDISEAVALSVKGKTNVAILSVVESKGIEFDRVYAFTKLMNPNEKYIAFTRALSFLYVIK